MKLFFFFITVIIQVGDALEPLAYLGHFARVCPVKVISAISEFEIKAREIKVLFIATLLAHNLTFP